MPSNDKKLRLAVIGAGSWAQSAHLPTLKEFGDIEFVGVCRKGADALARVKENFGFSIASEDYQDVLTSDVNLVVVSSPSSMHHEHVKAALDIGATVLCEKPVTIDPKQAWDLVERSKEAEREVVVAFGWNFSKIVTDFKIALQNANLGKVEHLAIYMSSSTRELLSNSGSYPDAHPDALPEQATWTDPAISGGGYGQAQLSHALALALHLVDERISGVTAITSNPGGAPVELHDAALFKLDGGGIGTLSGASGHTGAWKNKHALEVKGVCEQGQFTLDLLRECAHIYSAKNGDVHLPLADGAGAYYPEGPTRGLVSVARGESKNTAAPISLGAKTVEALAALYRSSLSGKYETRL